MTKKIARIVLAFSGSLEASVAVPWLADAFGAEIVAVTIDFGQGRELEEVRDRALATGAVRAHVLDARDEFARGYLLRGLKADATALDGAPIGEILGQALIARQLVQIAGIEQATAIAHAATGTAIDTAARTLNPALRVLAPARDWAMTASQQRAYARARQIPLSSESPLLPAPAALNGPAETGRSVPPGRDGGYPETSGLPKQAAVEVAFARGLPTGINGVGMPILDLFDSLGTIAAAHGVGGPKRPDLRDAPAATVLHAAHRALRTLVASDDLNRLCGVIGREYADLARRGLWFTPAREALDAFVDAVNQRVTGVVRLRLCKGRCEVLDAHETPPPTKFVAVMAND